MLQIWQLSSVPDSRLYRTISGSICHKIYYWVNGEDGNIDGGLVKSTVNVISVKVNNYTVDYRGISLFLGNIYWRI